MFYNLKIAIRNLHREKLYSWINIGGMAVSITATVLILLWVQDEWNYDRFYKNTDHIYRVISHSTENGKENYSEYNVVPLAKAAKAEIPDVENACSFGYGWDLGYLQYGTEKCVGDYFNFSIADTTFFSMFEMEFVEGDARHALSDPHAVVLTEEWAQQLFKNETAVGKIIKGNNGKDYQVTGVVKKPKQNSIFQFKALFSFEQSKRKERWNQWTVFTYLKLQEGADIQKVGTQLSDLHKKNTTEYSGDFPYLLQPLSQSHLYAPDGSETGMKNVRLFTIVAIALLSIACINYINLVTSRTNKKGKDISLRKIIGAKKSSLFLQMIGESSLIFILALLISQVLLNLVLPAYSTITGKEFGFMIFDAKLWLLYLIIFVFIILLAGTYPAIRLSSFRPMEVFRSSSAEKRSPLSIRKILVVLQFACSASLILITIVMSRQQHFMQTKNSGYTRENTFAIDLMANTNSRIYQDAFMQELARQPEIAGITGSEQNIIDAGNFTGIEWDGKPENLNFSTCYMGIDRNFLNTLNISLTEGTGFTGTPADSSYVLLNETAVKQMNLTDPLNTSITISWFNRGKMRVVGVVKDFHFRHMHEPIGPILLYLPRTYWTIYIKAAPGKTKEALATAEKIWKKYDQDYPFNYQFMDDTFAKMYEADTRASHLFNAFAIIAILISCLGLFGLVTYTAETKTKEIGIRKVLGASVKDITSMLTKEFLILVGIAMLIAFPLAYYWSNKMLEEYAYRISITWWMFAGSALITIILTLLTVSWQSIKAATANPVKSIKSE